MYIPIIKNRTIELDVLCERLPVFNKIIIPFIEIVEERKFSEFIKDENNKRVYDLVGGRKKYKKTVPVVWTIDELLARFGETEIFVQYFRYDIERYEADYSKVPKSYAMNDDLDLYLNESLKLAYYPNFIPVIILKPNVRNDDLSKITETIIKIKEISNVGLRLDVEILDLYADKLDRIINLLNEDDFLFFDLLEQNYINYEDEIEEVIKLNTNCKKVIMKAYRKRTRYNNSFDIGENPTALKTYLRYNYANHGFDGYSDFCGLQDRVPNNGRGVYGTVLIYNIQAKKYISYRSPQIGVNPITRKGGRADFKMLRNMVLTSSRIIKEPQYIRCPGIKTVKRINSGGFGEWKRIAMQTYLHSMIIEKGLI